jgi:hypothetical protein
MCTFQVFAANNTHSDPEKDTRASWKRGMVVAVYEDGVCTEPPSPNSKTVFIHIPGVTKSQVARYLMDKVDTRDGELKNRARSLARRRFRFDFSSLPQNIIKTLQQEREVTVNNLSAAKAFIHDSITGRMGG